jgi:hypothetical protein
VERYRLRGHGQEKRLFESKETALTARAGDQEGVRLVIVTVVDA